jgi:hypothetical protein
MATSTAPLNAFSILLQKGKAPAVKTAGARRSSRTSKPSGRLRDAQESTTQSNLRATLNKRPTVTDDKLPTPIRKSMKATVEDTDDDEGDNIFEAREYDEMPELVDDSDDEDDEPQAAYNHTKAMGDADREVCGYHTPLLVPLTSMCRLGRRHQKMIRWPTSKLSSQRMIPGSIPILKRLNLVGGVTCAGKKLAFATSCLSKFFCSDGGLSTRDSFFKGSISTLCTHISRYVHD